MPRPAGGAAAAAADAGPFASLLAGASFTLLDHGRAVAFELALDELYVPNAPVGKRLRQVARQLDAPGLLSFAESLGAAKGAVPNLVIYPAGQPRNQSTRRIVTDRLLLHMSDPAAAERIANAADLRIISRPDYALGYGIFGTAIPGKVDLMAAMYAVVAGQSVLKAANGANLQGANADGNAVLTFSGRQLTESLNKAANLSIADLVTKIPSNDSTFTLMINRTTGVISGTFAHTDDTVPSYTGIIYQKGPDSGAYGFFLTKQPVPINYTVESGGVSLLGQP